MRGFGYEKVDIGVSTAVFKHTTFESAIFYPLDRVKIEIVQCLASFKNCNKNKIYCLGRCHLQ